MTTVQLRSIQKDYNHLHPNDQIFTKNESNIFRERSSNQGEVVTLIPAYSK
jgi:hypothetical protein